VWEIKKIVSKGDYDYAVVPEHPYAIKHGYVLYHRIVMENHLGRLLDPNEVVHHKNRNRKDNQISNLEVMCMKSHVRMHGLSQGMRMVLFKCPFCKKLFPRPKNKSSLVKPNKATFCSRRCNGSFSRMIQLYGKTIEMERSILGNIVREYSSLDSPE